MNSQKQRKEALEFRPITYEDTANNIRWRNNPDVKENFVIQDDLTEETHLNWMKTRVETGEVKQFIIHYKSRNTDIGTAYLRDIDPEKGCAEAGAYIGESEYIGKGLGLELGRKLIDVGFNDLNLRYIYIRVLKDNAGTIRFNEMLGYKRIDNPEDFGIPGSGDDRVVFMMIQSRATTLDKA